MAVLPNPPISSVSVGFNDDGSLKLAALTSVFWSGQDPNTRFGRAPPNSSVHGDLQLGF